jgi:PAS domain S-box-containing protein
MSQLKYLSLGLIVLLALSFLYSKTQAVDLNKHSRLLDSANQFKREDAVLNQNILAIRHGLLPFYDPTVTSINRLNELQTDMTRLLPALGFKDSSEVKQIITSSKQAVMNKRDRLEDFKTHHAILRNSLRFLPIATAQLAENLPPSRQRSVQKKALSSLLRNILIYNLNSETGLHTELVANIEELRSSFNRQVPSRQSDIKILLSHAGIVLKNKKRVDELVQILLTLPTTQHMDELLGAYAAGHNQMMHNINIYRQILYGFSVALLLCIAYILFRLNRSSIILRRTVTDLNYQKFAMDQHAIVSISDKDGNITYANQKYCDINQRSAEELIGQNHRLARSGYHPDSFFKNMWHTITRGEVWRGQIQNRARDGSHYWTDTTIVPFLGNKGTPYQYVAIRTDITGLKQVEQALQEKEARIRMVVESALDAIILIDEHSVILEWNPQAEVIFGWTSSQAIGRTLTETIIPPQHREAHRCGVETLLATGKGPILNRINELTALHREGREFPVELSVSPLQRGNTWVFSAFVRDVSERQQTEQALRRSQKMEAIGQLSGGIAHDFNNQLGVIFGYLDFLQDYASNDEKPRQWVETATRATQRCSDLTRQLLAFSRRQARQKITLDLNNTVSELETMVARSLTPEVEVRYFLAEGLWPIEIDPGEFQDAMLNLVINARDAMPDGGTLLIETSNKHLDVDYVALNPEAEAGDYVQLMLSDTGTGIDKATLEHVFEPFFTTKPEGKGTGLGMAMVYGFVKRYGGYIKIYSEPGMGTTIRLYLPRASAPESAKPTNDAPQHALPRGDESILIVDDEADLLQLAERYLSDLGYRTRTAGNAAQALSILEQDGQIDLLFSDVVMPGGMNGYELAQQAVQQSPELRVLLTSGFTSKTLAHNGLTRFSTHLLSKPYRKDDLAQRIRLVFDEALNGEGTT